MYRKQKTPTKGVLIIDKMNEGRQNMKLCLPEWIAPLEKNHTAPYHT